MCGWLVCVPKLIEDTGGSARPLDTKASAGTRSIVRFSNQFYRCAAEK